jgi:HK97 family phage major capsid protein
MVKISELQHQRAEKYKEARSLLDKSDAETRALTVEEDTKYQALEADIEILRARIEREERLQALEMEKVRGQVTFQADATAEDDRQASPPPKNPWRSFGEQLQAVVRASMPDGRIDPRLTIFRDQEERATSGMNEGVGSEGAFLIHTDYTSELLKNTYGSSVLASRCREFPISANSNGIKIPYIKETSRVDGYRWGGIISYWKGEAAAKEGSFPDTGLCELNLKKLTGLCYATDELIEDSVALEAWVNGAFTEEFSFKVDKAVFSGLGAGQPLGFMKAPCLVTVAKEAGQPADTIVYENILKMWSRCWAKSRFNAIWLINQDVEPQLYSLGITLGVGGAPVYIPPGGLSGSPYSTLFGRPVMPIEQASTLGDLGDICLVDLNQYLLLRKGGMKSASSIHVRFLNDETVFRFVLRTDGQPWWPAPLTPHSGSANTLSPFVTLAERA